MQNLRFAIRMLLKQPGFTAVAILTLALGIGANTAIFSVVDHLLSRPLPVEDADRLALVAQDYGKRLEYDFNYPLFRDYQRGESGFQQLSATAGMPVGLGTGSATERVNAVLVSGNFFAMLKVNAALGRTFASNEGVEIDDSSVIVLSHGLWVRKFGADPGVLGSKVTLNAKPFIVIGVAPREFTGVARGQKPDLYVPITMYGQLTADRPGNEHPLATRYFTWHKIMGRLKEGVPLSQAQASMRMLAGRIYMNAPINTETNVVLLPGAHGFTEGVNESRMPLNLLLATAALVLLIACANLANLQLARSATRTRDFAIRLALGAGRGRVMRELLTESLLLSLTGGALGLIVANWLVRTIEYFRPSSLSLDTAAGLDARVLAFAFIAAVLTGVLCGLAPAWRASRPQLSPELKGSGWSMEARQGRWSLRGALVVAQVALSLLVLVGAGLCLRSLNKLQALNPGVEPSQVVLMDFDLGLNNYTPPRAADFYELLLAQARVQQGVESASLVQVTPLNGGQPGGMSIERIEGSANAAKRGLSADVNVVASDYFRTLGIPLLRGREFNKLDNETGLKAVVINEAFARAYLPETDPMGKHLILPGLGEQKPVEIVGVVKDDHSRSLKDPPRRTMYFPVAQQPALNLTLAVRTGLNTAAAIAGLRQLAKQIDSSVPVFHVRTLAQQKTGFLSMQRMVAALLGGFGLLALLLAALGIYGVLAYSVSRRTREIGMRMALGAQVADVLRLVLGQGLRLVLAGMAIGFASALMATRMLRGFLFEITPLDPLTFGSVIFLLAAVALLASWLPARRAANVNPMEALRNE